MVKAQLHSDHDHDTCIKVDQVSSFKFTRYYRFKKILKGVRSLSDMGYVFKQ